MESWITSQLNCARNNERNEMATVSGGMCRVTADGVLGVNVGPNPQLPTLALTIGPAPMLDTTWSGRDVLQIRVIWLLTALGRHPRSVAASNLSFVRSRDARSSEVRKYAEVCWPVHEASLEIVKPRLVIVYGNSVGSPYSFLLG